MSGFVHGGDILNEKTMLTLRSHLFPLRWPRWEQKVEEKDKINSKDTLNSRSPGEPLNLGPYVVAKAKLQSKLIYHLGVLDFS